ncbi:MAG TPA: NADH-quinone oxidoreductase subunit N [Planctomycetaceae bacterium]|jgi:NADH-quinone oxidoreductase subunit N|nr:NADH-quinone oxidoreductase subunit N [Planctomycetaceae bacterium]
MSPFLQTVQAQAPEILLIGVACLEFLIGPFLLTEGQPVSRRVGRGWAVISLLALVGAIGVWRLYPSSPSPGLVHSDSLAWFGRAVAILAGIVLVLINWDEVSDTMSAEFHGVLLLIIAGVSLTAAANDLIMLFLALELVSIPTYIFLYLPRRQPGNPEATTKYFFLSIVSSAIMLYGFSFLYGAVGSTHLGAIHAALGHFPSSQSPAILLIAAACIVAGLSFRVTAVPFHFYAPDVFQGSHAGAGAMLAFIPKVAGFLALYRIIHFDSVDPFIRSSAESLRIWCETVFWLMAVASMIIGNVLALLQRDLKRLLAYSSVAHAGYMLVGLAAGHQRSTVGGTAALLFYLIAYGATISGVFGMLVLLKRGDRSVATIDDLEGLSQTHPAAAAVLMLLLFSLTGLPPTGGFIGKLNLLMAAWSQQTLSAQILAIVLAVNAAIAAGYYLRIVATMYLRPAPAGVEVRTSHHLPAYLGVGLCVVVSVGLFFFPGTLWDLVSQFTA